MSEFLDTDLRFSIVPEWVLDADLSDRAIRVYALIARYADNETLQAFPARETLAKRAGCSARSVDRAITELVKCGALAKEHRKYGDAYQSNLYTVRRIPKNLATVVSLPGDSGVTRVATPVTLPSDTDGELTITNELEPVERKPKNYIGSKFDEFWNLYPKKQGRGAAQKAFEKALNREKWETILDGVERFANDPNLPEKQFIPLASTWLNQDRWTDEPYAAPTVKLANWQKAALLAEKYRQEAGVKEIEYENKKAARELEAEVSSWLKGVDDE